MNRPDTRERVSSTVQHLGPPKRPLWPDGILHHGSRVALLLALAVLVTALFPPVDRMGTSRFAIGPVAEQDVVAEVSFDVPKTPDQLERDRREARSSVPPTFDYRPEAADSMIARMDRFFTRLDSLVASGDQAALTAFLGRNSIEPDSSKREILTDSQTRQRIRNTATRAVREILPDGVADASELLQYPTPNLHVREVSDQERTVSRASVFTPGQFYTEAVDLLPASASPDVQDILRLVLIQFMEHSLELNVQATNADREEMAQAVGTTIRVFEDQVILGANDPITEAKRAELQAYETALRQAGRLDGGGFSVLPFVGSGLLTVLLLGVFGLLLFFFRTEIYDNFRWIFLITLLVAAYFAGAAVIAHYELGYELLPVAFVALAVAVLWDGRMALVLAITLAVVTALQPYFRDFGPEVAGLTILGGAAAAMSVRAVRRRSQTWIFSALIAAAYAAGILSLAMMGGSSGSGIGSMLLWAGVNAVLSAVLAMGFMTVFELFTGITTDQTLLEWADSNRPLLKKLSMEAPGTYAHTINVANLAEAAAVAVDANGLLVRVGLFYHDIGKMLKPHYFVENQPDGRNPHDRLKPDKSAAIVKEHVTEGYRLAREENVPEIIARFIPEHHGTQRIGFFWEKAKEEYGEEGLDPDDFTYPGPRPSSKETAIAMLADSVESATRALQDPTPERVRDLIENIVDAKIQDRQLDDSPLTLREIRIIKEQFIKVLSSIYHHRIDYPQTKHLTERKGAPAESGKPPEKVVEETTAKRGAPPA